MKKFTSIIFVLSLMLASFTAGVEYQRGDVSQDGHVDIDDVTCLISYILNGHWDDEPVVPVTEIYTVNGVSFTMVEVESGTFMMGASEDDSMADDKERPVHQVTLSSFSIGQTEVTQALWMAVMGSNPSLFVSANGYTDNLQRPVERVSWNDCQTFITKLNQMTGKNFRLPTEAEREFAARGGNMSKGYYYAGSDTLENVAWYYDTSCALGSSSPDYGTHTVATKSPNELGLYDMSGNVWEWCQDRYGSYSSDAQTNPTGPASGSNRVARGGGWRCGAKNNRVTHRDGANATYTDNHLGLRLAL